jgi:hypothetical protein
MKKVKIICSLLIIAINFTSCYAIWSIRKYDIDYDWHNFRRDQINYAVRMAWNGGGYPFFSFDIYGYQEDVYTWDKKEHTYPGIKSITIDEMKIVTKNTVYDMKKYIYEIHFMDEIYSKGNYYNITDLKDFYNTGTIHAPSSEWFQGIEFLGKNPGVKYSTDKEITILLDIKIELQDGTIKQIKKEHKGKRKVEIRYVMMFTV